MTITVGVVLGCGCHPSSQPPLREPQVAPYADAHTQTARSALPAQPQTAGSAPPLARAPSLAPTAGTPPLLPPPPAIGPALQNLPALDPRRLSDGVVSVAWGRGVMAQGNLGVVSSVEAHATRAGIDVLTRGGNAVDAAVATALALAVTHPSAGNLGGGGFLLAKLGNTVEAIDFREDAPLALTDQVFWDMIKRGAKGPRAVGVPGTVFGLHLAHQRHGRLPWAEVVAPALRLAREGYVLGPRQAQTLLWALPEFSRDPVARETFYQKRPDPNVRIVQPRLALALERIAAQGRLGFYEGPTALDLVSSLGAEGLITLDDLKHYEAKIREPLYFDFYDFRVITMPPPSAGGVVLAQNLLMLAQSEVSQLSPRGGRRLHLLAEVSRRSQVERQFFVTAPERLTEQEQEQARSRVLDPMTWLGPHPINASWATQSSSLHPGYKRALSELPDTTHFSVVDAEGNAVSCTVTLSGSFGARMMTRETGVVLNNSVASFASVGVNTPAAGQRTISSMAPTFALLGEQHFLVLGSPGGNTIPNTVTQTFLHLALDGDSLDEAVRRPRVHQGFAPQALEMERFAPLPGSVQAQLRGMGHELTFARQTMGDANIAAYMNGTSAAVADAREGGLAMAAPPRPAPESAQSPPRAADTPATR